MPATFAVSNITNLTAPTGGYINEASVDESLEVAEVRDENGDVVIAKPKKLITVTETIKGKGDPEISAVTAGGFTEDTVKIIEAKGTESQDDFPDFEIVGRVFKSLA
jgi:hypothetical protein